MPSHPYDTAVYDDAEGLFFVAELRAFTSFGKRYDEIEQEYFNSELESPDYPQRVARAQEQLSGSLAEELRKKQPDVERLKETDPERYELLTGHLSEFEARLMMPHDSEDEDEDEEEDEDGDEEEEVLPLGQVRVFCGDRKRVTANQKQLFTWLLDNQDDLVPKLRSRIYAYYKKYIYPDCAEMPFFQPPQRRRLLLPEVVKGDELDDRLRLCAVNLHSSSPRIGLLFDCMWEQAEGNQLGVLISKQAVSKVGAAEVAIFE